MLAYLFDFFFILDLIFLVYFYNKGRCFCCYRLSWFVFNHHWGLYSIVVDRRPWRLSLPIAVVDCCFFLCHVVFFFKCLFNIVLTLFFWVYCWAGKIFFC